MYSSERANQKYGDFESNRLIAGIHENVTLTNVEKKVSPNGNKMLAFTFTQGQKSIEVTEWEPKASQYITLEDSTDRNFKKVQQILLAFFPGMEKLTVTASNFDEFANWVVATYNTVDKSTLLRVKFNYDKAGYVTIPKHGYYDTFIEPMSVEEAKVIKHKNDVFEKPIVADQEPKTSNPLADDNDLPF